jgi:hydroxymethylpyrimidine/phosphomethylpyrimidine kinase
MTAPRVLIVAGSDSGGGAGIQADIKTVTMLGGHAMTAVTAITAQNTLGVEAVMMVPPELVVQQIAAVVGDIGVDAVKIGMLGSAKTAAAVAEELDRLASIPVIFDPVMVATSGAELADEATVAAFDQMIAVSSLVTPNLPELAALTGRELYTVDEMEGAARAYAEKNGIAILAKGGHIEGDIITDFLAMPDGRGWRWDEERIDSRNTHGTGCTLASAIATGVARGLDLEEAVTEARAFVRRAILAAPGFGEGHGPMAHWAGPSA